MKRGRFVFDGPKDTGLTSKNISRLFDVPVEIMNKDGYYYAFGY
jgi:iron complex transport system ATP-binding protein